MKIKTDFITNSSTTSFLIVSENRILKKDIAKEFYFQVGEYFKKFSSRRKLIEITQTSKVDWVTEATNYPYRFRGMSKEEYTKADNALAQGKFVASAELNRNSYERHERFVEAVLDLGGQIVHMGSD